MLNSAICYLSGLFPVKKHDFKGSQLQTLSEDFGQDTGSFHAYVRSEKQFVVEHVRYIVGKGPAPTQGI